jgi:hypothetical protein
MLQGPSLLLGHVSYSSACDVEYHGNFSHRINDITHFFAFC